MQRQRQMQRQVQPQVLRLRCAPLRMTAFVLVDGRRSKQWREPKQEGADFLREWQKEKLRQPQGQGWLWWSPPSQNRDGGHPHFLDLIDHIFLI